MKFEYQREKLITAQSLLQLPHPGEEGKFIADAFGECQLALSDLKKKTLELDDDLKDLIAELEGIMDSSALTDPYNEGMNNIKAKTLSVQDKSSLSSIINDLVSWFSNHN